MDALPTGWPGLRSSAEQLLDEAAVLLGLSGGQVVDGFRNALRRPKELRDSNHWPSALSPDVPDAKDFWSWRTAVSPWLRQRQQERKRRLRVWSAGRC